MERPAFAGFGRTQTVDVEPALATVWPDMQRTLFLRACLAEPAEAYESWRVFVSTLGDPKSFIEKDVSGFKGLLPLLHASARRNAFKLDAAMWTYLRSATVREELRYGAYRDICGSVLKAYVDAGLPIVALKACALAETLYETPAQRHCHAIDLLVPAGSQAEAARIAAPLKFQPARLAEALPGVRQGLRHEFGLPLVIHSNLFDPPVYRLEADQLWLASSAATVAGAPVRVFSPTHNLLHILVAAFHDPRRNNLRWVFDAWRLIEEQDGKDWEEFGDLTRTSGLVLPVFTMLGYLAGPLGAQVPDDLLPMFADSARRSRRPAMEAALSAPVGGVAGLRAVWSRARSNPVLRNAVLRFLFWPSANYIRWRFAVNSRLALPLYYLYRPLSYVAEHLWWRMLKLPGLNRLTHYRRVTAELKKKRA